MSYPAFLLQLLDIWLNTVSIVLGIAVLIAVGVAVLKWRKENTNG